MSRSEHDPVTLRHISSVPFDPEVASYVPRGEYVPHTYTDWREETLSWKESCYLSANLSVYPDRRLQGPDLLRLLELATTNSYATFPVGSAKHIIMCAASGNIINHGVARRVADDAIVTMTDTIYLQYLIAKHGFDVTIDEQLNPETFLFQLAGPRALEVLEQATGEDFHELRFMRLRDATIAGHPVSVLRMGMGGTLSYEITGDSNAIGRDVYTELLRVGAPYGLTKLGANAYVANHTENGFPEFSFHWAGAASEDPDYVAYLESIPKSIALMSDLDFVPRGTLSADIRDFFRNPIELGWGHSVKFDHDFIGREALERIAAGNPRRMVTLVWNHEDMMKVFASFFQKEEEPYMDMPFPHEVNLRGGRKNTYLGFKVLKDGEQVGAALWRTYTLYYRETLSLACIDADLTEIGTEVEILYGDLGHRTLNIRARVERYPYLDLPANRDVDLDAIPRLSRVST